MSAFLCGSERFAANEIDVFWQQAATMPFSAFDKPLEIGRLAMALTWSGETR